MATSSTTEEQVSLKLVINKESNKVLFAEAGKDFVDTLFSFLTLPLGTIARLVQTDSSIRPVTVGCLNSLYKSVSDLDERCFCSNTIKQMLLQPSNSSEDHCNTLKLNIDNTQPTTYFACSKYMHSSRLDHYLITTTIKDKYKCYCGSSFSCPVFPKRFSQGFVKCAATFVITDDLTVIPNCIDYPSFGILHKFGIKEPNSMKEMIMNVTKDKVLDLLKCSLLSKSTLTDFFLVKRPSIAVPRFFLCNIEVSGEVQIKVKLVIRKSDGKVLCAQGEKDFANLLLSFLTFPLGGIINIFGENCSLGSISRLHKSIADLNENICFISNEEKNKLVEPCTSPLLKLSEQILPILEPGSLKYYCYTDSNSNVIRVQFSNAGEDKSNAVKFTRLDFSNQVDRPEGYVIGPSMYVVTDDLVIVPLSPISALGLLHRFKTSLDDLKEKIITIGIKEALNILKAALTSTSALTNGLAHLLTDFKEEKLEELTFGMF